MSDLYDIAVKDIDSNLIEIIPKDTGSNSDMALDAAIELSNLGVKIIIGPVFNESLAYLNKVNEITFLALTNKNNNFSKNIINAGINATSQLNAIKKFIKLNEIKNLNMVKNYSSEQMLQKMSNLLLSFLEDRRDYIQGKIDKWKQKEGSTCDDIIFTNGIREITFDEWIKLEYK